MGYYYEYKEKNGAKVGGHNLEKINIQNNIIRLEGIDVIEEYDDYKYSGWVQYIDMDKIEYLKITPMEDEEK